jgi:hypothetical protein
MSALALSFIALVRNSLSLKRLSKEDQVAPSQDEKGSILHSRATYFGSNIRNGITYHTHIIKAI